MTEDPSDRADAESKGPLKPKEGMPVERTLERSASPAPLEKKSARGRHQHWLVSGLVLLDAVLFYVFYTKFIPEGLASQLTGVSAVFAGVLTIGGLREPGKILLEDIRWKPTAKVVVTLAALVLSTLNAIGWIWTPTVEAVTGSTILVDGKKYKVVSDKDLSLAGGSIRQVPLILTWGTHEITVSRKGYVALAGEVPECTQEVRAPSHDRMGCHHASFLHFRAGTIGDPSGSDKNGDADWKNASLQRDALLLALDHSFELPDDTVPPGSIGSTEDHLPSLTLEIGVEQRPIDVKPYLTFTTLDREGILGRRYPRILSNDSSQILTEAAISIRSQLFAELSKIPDATEDSSWRDRIPHLLSDSLAIVEARDELDQARQLMGKVVPLSSTKERQDLLKEIQEHASRACERVSRVLANTEDPDPHLRILAGRVAVLFMDVLSGINAQAPDRLGASGETVAKLAELAKNAGQLGLARKAVDTFKTMAQQAAHANVPDPIRKSLAAQQSQVTESLNGIPTLRLQKSEFNLPGEGLPNNNGYIGDFGCTGRTATVLTLQNRPVGYIYFYESTGAAKPGPEPLVTDSFSVLLSGISNTMWKDAPRIKSRVTFTGKDPVGTTRSIDVGRLRYKVTLTGATLDTSAPGKFAMNTVQVAVHVEVVPEPTRD